MSCVGCTVVDGPPTRGRWQVAVCQQRKKNKCKCVLVIQRACVACARSARVSVCVTCLCVFVCLAGRVFLVCPVLPVRKCVSGCVKLCLMCVCCVFVCLVCLVCLTIVCCVWLVYTDHTQKCVQS